MTELLHDTNFWVLISFLIFVVGVFVYGRKAILGSLDSKIDAIKTELEEAERIRVDAQELLAEYQRKHKDAMNEADKIVAEAKKHAESIREKAEADMANATERREAQLNEKLSRLEQQAAQDIQAYTAKIVVNAARDVLTDKMDSKSDKDMIADTMDGVSKTLN